MRSLAGASSNPRARKFVLSYTDLLNQFAQRVIEEADQDGVLWTPILDACMDVYDSFATFHAGWLHNVGERFDRFAKALLEIRDAAVLEPLAHQPLGPCPVRDIEGVIRNASTWTKRLRRASM